MAWWEGEDVDPDSGVSHITKAIATLVVLRDSQINNMVDDDRPIRPPATWMFAVQNEMDEVNRRMIGAEQVSPFLERDRLKDSALNIPTSR